MCLCVDFGGSRPIIIIPWIVMQELDYIKNKKPVCGLVVQSTHAPAVCQSNGEFHNNHRHKLVSGCQTFGDSTTSRVDGGSGDNWSYNTCKTPVKSSPTNQQLLQGGCPTSYQQCHSTAQCTLHCVCVRGRHSDDL